MNEYDSFTKDPIHQETFLSQKRIDSNKRKISIRKHYNPAATFKKTLQIIMKS